MALIATPSAATPDPPYGAKTVPAPPADAQPSGRWGERNASAFADYNSDGVNDVFVAAPFETIAPVTQQGRVFLLSGKDMALGSTVVIRQFDSPQPQNLARFGFFISVPGDVDGDGKPDIAAGTDSQDVGSNVDQGRAWVFSGATGTLLYTLDNPFPQARARFGSRIGAAGDVNGNGVPDVIVGASNNDVPAGCGNVSPIPSDCRANQGQAFIFEGSTGALIRTLDLPAEDQAPAPCTINCGNLGLAVQGPGDGGTPGAPGSSEAGALDGIVDQLVDGGSANGGKGRMYLYSGADGALIRKIDNPDQVNNRGFFGFQDAAPLSPGDVGSMNNSHEIGARDGYVELYGNGFLQTGPTGLDEGRAWVFDGKTGQVMYSLEDPTPEAGGQFGWSMAGTEFNSDVFPDLYVGQSPHHLPGASGNGGTYVFSGHLGGLLKSLELPAACSQPSTGSNLGPNLGWGLAAPGDLNGDGSPDYVAGAPFTDVNGVQDQGLQFAFVSGSTETPAVCQ